MYRRAATTSLHVLRTTIRSERPLSGSGPPRLASAASNIEPSAESAIGGTAGDSIWQYEQAFGPSMVAATGPVMPQTAWSLSSEWQSPGHGPCADAFKGMRLTAKQTKELEC